MRQFVRYLARVPLRIRIGLPATGRKARYYRGQVRAIAKPDTEPGRLSLRRFRAVHANQAFLRDAGHERAVATVDQSAIEPACARRTRTVLYEQKPFVGA